MTIRLVRKRQFALAEESVEGTKETLVAGDVPFEVEELAATYANAMNERTPLRSSLSGVPSLPGIGTGTITGKVELVGGGTTTTKPPTAELFRACGYKEYTVRITALSGASGTFTPGEQITDGGAKEGRVVDYTGANLTFVEVAGTFAGSDAIAGTTSGATGTAGAPADLGFAYIPTSVESGTPSYTALVNQDGLKTEIFGARGSFTIDIEGAGKLAYMNFTLSGKANKPSDEALFTGLTLPTVTPEAFLSAGLVKGADSLCVDALGFDAANTVSPRPCANEALGIVSYRITDRKPATSIDPEADLEANVDHWNEYATAVESYFSVTVGTTASKRMRIVAARNTYSELSDSDREGIHAYSAVLRHWGDQPEGDDEVIIAFF